MATEIRLTNPTISKILFGASSSPVKEAYIGNTLVYKAFGPVYEAENLTFNGSNYVDTGINIWKYIDGTLGNNGFSIVIEFSTTQAENSWDSPTIFHNMKEDNPWPGLVFDVAYGGGRVAGRAGQDVGIFTKINDGIKKKLIITCDGQLIKYNTYSNGELDMYGTAYLSNPNQCNSTNITQNLILGAYQQLNGSKGRYFNGNIYSFKFFDKVLSDDEMKKI